MRHQGQLDALRLDQRMHRGRQESSTWYWGGSIFWDSDVAKWLEAASAYLQHHKDAKLDTLVDGTIELLAGAQQPDGYLNSHILTACDKNMCNQDDSVLRLGQSRPGRNVSLATTWTLSR
jgi:DUF1680 family protein